MVQMQSRNIIQKLTGSSKFVAVHSDGAGLASSEPVPIRPNEQKAIANCPAENL
jgi:hypothetical protein